jgi:Spy/CpxP family protein refolding chaperone
LITAAYIDAHSESLQGKWWKSPEIRKELTLSPKQVEEIESIFGSYLPEMMRVNSNLRNQVLILREKVKNPKSSSDEIRRASIAVDETKKALSSLKLEMFLKIREVLTPEQRAKLHRIKSESLLSRKQKPEPKD